MKRIKKMLLIRRGAAFRRIAHGEALHLEEVSPRIEGTFAGLWFTTQPLEQCSDEVPLMSNQAPVLQWACCKLQGDWVMLGVDVDRSNPAHCRTLGYKVAMYRYCSEIQLKNMIRHMMAVMAASTCSVNEEHPE